MSATMTAPSDGGRAVSQASRLAGRVILVLWAGFWSWFLVADTAGHVIKEQSMVALLYGGGLLLAILSLGFVAWVRPRLGGTALIAYAAFAVYFFAGAPAVLLMALPPAAAGLLLWAGALLGRQAGRMPR